MDGFLSISDTAWETVSLFPEKDLAVQVSFFNVILLWAPCVKCHLIASHWWKKIKKIKIQNVDSNVNGKSTTGNRSRKKKIWFGGKLSLLRFVGYYSLCSLRGSQFSQRVLDQFISSFFILSDIQQYCALCLVWPLCIVTQRQMLTIPKSSYRQCFTFHRNIY